MKNIKKTIFLIVCCISLGLVYGDNTRTLESQLHGIQKKINIQKKKQQKITANIQQLTHDLGSLQHNINHTETSINQTKQKLRRLNTRLNHLHDQYLASKLQLQTMQKSYAETLMMIESIGTKDLNTILLTYPSDNPLQAIYASHIMGGIVESLHKNVTKIVHVVKKNEQLQYQVEHNIQQQKHAISSLHQSKKHLVQLIAYKHTLKNQNLNKKQYIHNNIEQLSAQQQNLQNLLNSLQKEEEKQIQQREKKHYTKKKPSIKNSRTFIAPVKGRIIRRYNSKTSYGTKLLGIQVRTLSKAKIKAPYNGKIVFANVFQGLGLIIILVQNNYYSTFVGMQHITVSRGMTVKQGSTIGIMPTKHPVLFFELRKKHKVINPLIKIPYKLWR